MRFSFNPIWIIQATYKREAGKYLQRTGTPDVNFIYLAPSWGRPPVNPTWIIQVRSYSANDGIVDLPDVRIRRVIHQTP